MKKPKKKAKADGSSKVWPPDPRHTYEAPTTEQLSLLAALLAIGQRKVDVGSLVHTANQIWYFADQQVEVEKVFAHRMKTRMPPDFFTRDDFDLRVGGISRDQFLTKILPRLKNRTADLAAIGKAYTRHSLTIQNQRAPTDEEVVEAWKNWKPYKSHIAANGIAHSFLDWYKRHISEARRAAGKRSAEKKLKKKL